MSRLVATLFKAILPDPRVNELSPDAILISVLGNKIRDLTPPADISEMMQRVEELLDESVATEGYIINAPNNGDMLQKGLVDLSKIDFDALQAISYETFLPFVTTYPTWHWRTWRKNMNQRCKHSRSDHFVWVYRTFPPVCP